MLNVGLSAGILSQRVFSMFVLEALLLTFLTTPCVFFYYPPEVRVRVTSGDFNQVTSPREDGGEMAAGSSDLSGAGEKTRFTVVLDKIEHMPGMLALTQLIIPPHPPYIEPDVRLTSTTTVSTPSMDKSPSPEVPATAVSLDAIRLLELSDRTSAVMKSSNINALTTTDPLLDIFSTFGALHGIPVSTTLSIVPFEDLGATVAEHATRNGTQLVLVPWLPPQTPIGDNSIRSDQPTGPEHSSGGAMLTPRLGHIQNPFEAIFRATSAAAEDRDVSISHSQFVRGLFGAAKTDVALFVDRHTRGGGAAAPARGGVHRLFVPFFGGPDDRLALDFAVQLCANPRISATVVRITKREGAELAPTQTGYSVEKSDLAMPEPAHTQNQATIASVSTNYFPLRVPCFQC